MEVVVTTTVPPPIFPLKLNALALLGASLLETK
jgi:hypothetical protein